jgi:alpha-L-rhamnosidase
MTAARAEYDSVYGKIVSDWKGGPTGPFSLKVTIPPNTSAKVFLPAIPGAKATEGGNPIKTQSEGGAAVVRVGSGTYNFEIK